MIKRLRLWLTQMLFCFDFAVGTWLRGWYYVWVGGQEPFAEESISAWVGRRAAAGVRWALIARAVIDWLFGSGHCQRAANRYAGIFVQLIAQTSARND